MTGIVPSYFILYKASGQNIDWSLVSGSTPTTTIDTATITATLYKGRGQNDPVAMPGTPVDFATAINLAFQTAGLYTGVITNEFDPPIGTDYVMVVVATAPGYLPQQWEVPTVVEVRTGA